jgi:hypothetical protein
MTSMPVIGVMISKFIAAAFNQRLYLAARFGQGPIALDFLDSLSQLALWLVHSAELVTVMLFARVTPACKPFETSLVAPSGSVPSSNQSKFVSEVRHLSAHSFSRHLLICSTFSQRTCAPMQ